MSMAMTPIQAPALSELLVFPQDEQDRVRDWLRVLDDIQRRGREAILEHVGAGVGSQATIYRMLKRWERMGWSGLLDRRHFRDLQAKAEVQLPDEFLRYVAGQMLNNQRKSRPAWRSLIEQWRRWRAGDVRWRLPGYQDCPPLGQNGRHPDGWSYENLMRRAQPSQTERAIARVGTAAAKSLLPYVPGTREGSRWLEYVFFDDVYLDRKILVPGYRDPARVLQLGALDYSTGYYLLFGQRPELPDDEGKRQRLLRRDFLWLVATVIERFGFPSEYDMHLIVERGTATMSQAEAQLLFELSEGRIKVCYTSMEGQLVLAWEEKSSGNWSAKACLESFHNPLHNELAAHTGQVGKDWDSCPAALTGMEREAKSLSRLGVILTPEQRARLVLPFPNAAECYQQTLEAVDRIHRRTDHACEGFSDVVLWRVRDTGMEWQTEAALATADPTLLDHLEFSRRVESRHERMLRLSHGVRVLRLPAQVWTRFYEDGHVLGHVERCQIEVRVLGKTLIFGPTTPDEAIPDGTEIMGHYWPVAPETMHITVKGRYVATWQHQKRIRRGDAEAVSGAIKRKQQFLNAAAGAVRAKQWERLLEEDRRVSGNLAAAMSDVGVTAVEGVERICTRGAEGLQEISNRLAKATQEERTHDQALSRAARSVGEDDFERLTTPDQEDSAPMAIAEELQKTQEEALSELEES